jgi:hypothetical protein
VHEHTHSLFRRSWAKRHRTDALEGNKDTREITSAEPKDPIRVLTHETQFRNIV